MGGQKENPLNETKSVGYYMTLGISELRLGLATLSKCWTLHYLMLLGKVILFLYRSRGETNAILLLNK